MPTRRHYRPDPLGPCARCGSAPGSPGPCEGPPLKRGRKPHAVLLPEIRFTPSAREHAVLVEVARPGEGLADTCRRLIVGDRDPQPG